MTGPADRAEGSEKGPPTEPRNYPPVFPARRRGALFRFYAPNPAAKIVANSPTFRIGSQLAELSAKFVPANQWMADLLNIRSPLTNWAEEINRIVRAQWAPIFESFRTFARQMFPENWEDIELPSVEVLESILVDEGIPVMWVPRGETLEAFFQAGSASERRRIIGRRWKGIVTDCETVLHGVTAASIQGEREFALDCVRALRDGHTNPAQALAANLLDSVLRKYISNDSRVKLTRNDFKQNGVKFNLDDHGLRVAFTFAPVWCAHAKYRKEHGDAIPSAYGRHPSAHAVSRTQYKRVNAVTALMVVTSVIKFLDVELARREAR